jgi:hypothetical protein
MAILLGNDTTLVVVEVVIHSVDTNSDGTLLEESLQTIGGWKSWSEGSGMNLTLGSVIFAGSRVFGVVRIVSFKLEGVTHGGDPSHEWVTSMAAHINVGAIYELLLGERQKLSGFDLVCTFERASGAEGPARSAMALIFDGGDSALGSPVDSSSVGIILQSRLDIGLVDRFIETIDNTESILGRFLFFGPIGELVDFHGEGLILLGVMSINNVSGFLEKGKSLLELMSGVIVSIMLGNETIEVLFSG